MLAKPQSSEYPTYYSFYIDLMPDDILEFLENQTDEVLNLYKTFSEKKLLYKYAEGKWTIKEMLSHLLDSEIIFAYRALTYARKDKSNLPMYDHDEYVNVSHANKIDSYLLIDHYETTRKSNLLLFKSFTDEEWMEEGITDGKKFTTRTIPYITAGHTNHHIKVLKERYL